MNEFLRRLGIMYFEICRLRRGPQDLPAYPVVLWASLALYTLTNWMLAGQYLHPGLALLQAIIDTALLSTITYFILHFRHVSQRTAQTVSALAGSGAFIEFMSWPLLYWGIYALQTKSDAALPALGLLAMGIWRIAIMSHIFRHALSTTPGWGLFTAVGYLMVVFLVMQAIFPGIHAQ